MTPSPSLHEIYTYLAPLARRASFMPDTQGNWSTRLHGNAGEETPGREDIAAAHELAADLEKHFDNVRVQIQTCDEWTSFTVQRFPHPLPPLKPTTYALIGSLLSLESDIRRHLMSVGVNLLDSESDLVLSSDRKHFIVVPDDSDTDSAWHISIYKWTGKDPTIPEEIRFMVGRHTVKLDRGTPAEILAAFVALGADTATRNYRDVYDEYIILQSPVGFLRDPWESGLTCPADKAYKFRLIGDPNHMAAKLITRHRATLWSYRRGVEPSPYTP